VGLRSEEAVVSGYPFHFDLIGFLPFPASPLSQSLDPGIFTVLFAITMFASGVGTKLGINA
jgi:hypothetical protein